VKYLRQRALNGEVLAGAWLNLGSSLTAEMAGRAGFDWALIDLEHGVGDQESLLSGKEGLAYLGLEAKRHETQPPARYTEAALIKELESNGIGRPSTYASIIATIQNRGYVFRQGKALVPSFTAFAVTELLRQHFTDYVDPGFTAEMEEVLDQISNGERDWLDFVKGFYRGDLEPIAPHEVLPGLERTIAGRAAQPTAGSYTAQLLADPPQVGEKVEEEAEEVARAAREESDERVAEEAADVLYHLAVLLRSRGLGLADAEEVLSARRR